MKEMDREMRLKMIESEQDELGPLTEKMVFEVPACPACGADMAAQRPKTIVSVIPKFDYKCPKCGTCVSASGIIT